MGRNSELKYSLDKVEVANKIQQPSQVSEFSFVKTALGYLAIGYKTNYVKQI